MNETAPSDNQALRQRPDHLTLALRVIVGAIGAALVLAAAWFGYAYVISPEAIRHPHGTHYHLRLQVINNGTPVNFADDKFQTPLNIDTCSAVLTKEPIHFHDKLDQFVHVHWDYMTGGLLLKNYGWNFLTGPDETLGYRFDKLPRLTRVPIHGEALPKPLASAKYYVFVGDATSHWEQSWQDFLRLDLRDFFAGRSGKSHATSWLDTVAPSASARAGETHAASASDEKLTKLNDVIGSVVIFVQKDRPTDQQINDRFNHLVPLPESTCGG